jgi:hypothetical protein
MSTEYRVQKPSSTWQGKSQTDAPGAVSYKGGKRPCGNGNYKSGKLPRGKGKAGNAMMQSKKHKSTGGGQ